MSFASQVREELCREIPEKRCCRVAECYGILLYCNTFTKQEIRIVTGHRAFAQMLPRLFRRTFGVDFDQQPDPDQPGKLNFIITDREKLSAIFAAFDQEHDTMALHINFGILENQCCRRSFIRGAFLAGGSVTDPDKRYHLELVTGHIKVSDEARSLLRELDFDLKSTSRSGNSVLYLKQSDRIVDFLTMMGAPLCAMQIIETKVEKSVRNSVNRRVNCDTANVSKAVDAAQEQLAAIRRLRETGTFDALPPKLRETALLREEYPEATLSELAEMVDPPLSKPALSHRMRSIIERSRQES